MSTVLLTLWIVTISCSTNEKGKLAGNTGGNEREAVVYSRENGLEAWAVTGVDGGFEFSLAPGEYMVSCGGRLAPCVLVRAGQTTYINHSDDPSIEMDSEMWTPAHLRFGQSYTATGTAFEGVSFWMPQGSTRLQLSLREVGPDGRLLGEFTTQDKQAWFASVRINGNGVPTIPGQTYYLEIAGVEQQSWCIGMPKGPDVYSGGLAYYDGVPHPESDLGISILETKAGFVQIAAAKVDQHFIKEGPGSGLCKLAGQSFIAKNGGNILVLYANCGFGGGIADFIYTIYQGKAGGKVLAKKTARMVSDWGSSVYLFPDEVILERGAKYYFEYQRQDGKPFYSYLSADVYPDGRAYRDGKEIGDFDQLFEIIGEVEPGGITFPYNVKATNVTETSAAINWETGTAADGIVFYGSDVLLAKSAWANREPAKEHSLTLSGLSPATVCYYRVTSFTQKQGTRRAYGPVENFMTKPKSKDEPLFILPEPVMPLRTPDQNGIPLVNGSFEDGLKGWSRCSSAKPKKYEQATGECPIGNGPFGETVSNRDGYKPHSGRRMYGLSHVAEEDPNPLIPREDWKQEVIHQRIATRPGHTYVLKAWIITGDRGSGWGRDSRIRLVVDTEDRGLLNSIDTVAQAKATQWFATENLWREISLRFTAESNNVDIGTHFLQWWALDANYLYADDVSISETK